LNCTAGVTYQFSAPFTGVGGSRDKQDNVKRGGGLIVFTFAENERVDTNHDQLAFGLVTGQKDDAILVSITSANSNDYIRIELVCISNTLIA
jgi:hypothetical protein